MTSVLEDIWRASKVEAPRHSMTWLELVEDFLAAKDVSSSSLATYREHCDGFTKHLGTKSRDMLWSITNTDCEKWYQRMTAAGLNATTARNTFKTVLAALQRAVLRGIIPQNPGALVRTPMGRNDPRFRLIPMS